MRYAVITTGRQDWGYLRPLCTEMIKNSAHSLKILAGGMACDEKFGQVAHTIAEQGFPLSDWLEWDVQASAAEQCAQVIRLFSAAFEKEKTEVVLLLGDRFETAAVALAATLMRLPIVHLYGGDETEGAIDNTLRHAITKMSHLHLVSHQAYADRVRQMGEHPGSVHVIGLLSLDRAWSPELPDRTSLEKFLGIPLEPPVGIVTVHPTTLKFASQADEVEVILEAMDRFHATWVITLPNADPDNEHIRQKLIEFSRGRQNAVTVPVLGEDRYFGLLRIADFMLGNSSSGVIEAPALKVPSINVGDRQKGRLKPFSVIDVSPTADAVVTALAKACSDSFKNAVEHMEPIFDQGNVAYKAVDILNHWRPLVPPRKKFYY